MKDVRGIAVSLYLGDLRKAVNSPARGREVEVLCSHELVVPRGCSTTRKHESRVDTLIRTYSVPGGLPLSY